MRSHFNACFDSRYELRDLLQFHIGVLSRVRLAPWQIVGGYQLLEQDDFVKDEWITF